MRKIRLSKLIAMGQIARYLYDVKPNWPIHGPTSLVSNIDNLSAELAAMKFKVTVAASDDLLALAEELRATPPGTYISSKDSVRLNKIMDRMRHTLRAEARTLNAYVLNEKRFDVLKLVANPASFFGEGTFEKLPRIAQLDIREAGKCIGFELPTAGAFHLLRATEDSLRTYYKVFFKRAKIEKSMWGPLINSLRTKTRKPKPSETLLNHLDHIRNNFRNPTDHPDMVYDMDGVQDLFSLVVDVLNRMAKEFPDRSLEWIDDIPETLAGLYGLSAPSELIPASEFPVDAGAPVEPDTGDTPPSGKDAGE
jgi:hypothetical protein